jgi:hypothetical protein
VKRGIVMSKTISDIYRGWKISVTAKDEKCSHYSFDITSPAGTTQSVFMGGVTAERAIERAREMIDMEIAFADEE